LRYERAAVIVWTLIVCYIVVVCALVAYFSYQAVAARGGVHCDDPVTIVGDDYGTSSQACDG
jgi:hypothetical protein